MSVGIVASGVLSRYPPVDSGLALWLDASDATTFTITGSRAVSVPILQWRDKSSYGRHFSGGNAQRTGSVNGKTAVAVTGPGGAMTGPVISTATTNFSIFTVCRRTSGAIYSVPFYNGVGSTNGYGPAVQTGSGKYGYLEGSLVWLTGAYPDDGQVHVHSLIRGPSIFTGYLDGFSINAGSATAPIVPTTGSYIPSNISGHDFAGDICEILFYTREVSALEKSNIEGYLAAKWMVRSTSTLVDTFDSTLNLATWTSINLGNLPVWEAGQIRMNCMSSTYTSIGTGKIFDLRGAAITSKITHPVPADGRTTVMMYELLRHVASNKVNWFEIEIDSTATTTSIYADRQVNGVYASSALIPYNATTHAWVRIRETDGTVYFETSPDTYRWAVLWSFPTTDLGGVLYPGSLFIGCGLRYGSLSGSAGYVDNVNAPIPKTAILTDTFDFTVDKVTKWDQTSSAVVWDASGRAKIPAVWNQWEMATTRKFAFTDTSFIAKVDWPMTSTYGSDMRLNGGSKDVGFEVKTGTLSARMDFVRVGPSVPWTTSHQWLRIRESAGTTYFDTSPQGTTWTTLHSVTTPAAYNNTLVLMAISAGSPLDVATEFVYVDNVNVPP